MSAACGDDAAAYALGALEPAEAEAFRRHLEGCASCREDVVAFQRVTGALPAASPEQPVPRALRRRVMHEVKMSPRPAPGPAEPTARAPEQRGRPAAAGRPQRSILPRPALLTGAAVLLLAAAVLIGAAIGSSGGSGPTRVIQASVGNAELRITAGQGQLIVNHLPQPQAGRIYEVWLQHAGRAPAPTKTLFSVTSAGSGAVGVPGSLSGVSAVLVTQEPAGGSLSPTSPPVIVAHLT